MTQTVTVFAVPDASCDRCRQTIQAELHQHAGVRDVQVDLPGKVVRVAHDPQVAPVAVLADRLERSGYPVAGASEAA
jgi:copper chaperone CopZ